MIRSKTIVRFLWMEALIEGKIRDTGNIHRKLRPYYRCRNLYTNTVLHQVVHVGVAYRIHSVPRRSRNMSQDVQGILYQLQFLALLVSHIYSFFFVVMKLAAVKYSNIFVVSYFEMLC